jgi:hypothetical protein
MSKHFSAASSRKRRVKNTSRFTATDKWRVAGIVIFLLAATGVIRWLGSAKPPVPPFLDIAEAQRTFAATLLPTQFKDPMIKTGYAVALKIPRVLAQQPCYCGCNEIGHRSLLDCYRSTHAAECTICIKEAILASGMHDTGKTATEIRNAIIAGDWRQVR